ncbi:transposase [Paludicola sp. MB14-C6]|uniref:transposase n=1 Tax=Paludihabitans sp. MB14-C6 TaxID=3070656 RepID=UPI0027DC7BF5|nr:transposase [Paludicola sp. MB14-C6]WMJ22009.1 transposase [Paludicola sp. MB14-C6]
MNELPQRKLQRLKGYDYSHNGAYFITICTQNRQQLFGEIFNNTMLINNAGKMIEERLLNIINDVVFLDKHIIMPDHIHAIVIINHNGTTQGPFPTLSEIVQRFKTITTKLYIDSVKNGEYPPFDKKIWQKSFNDRIIRNEKEYREIRQYIDENPLK